MSDEVIKKYLDHYAEKEALQLTVQRKYDHSLVIPANREILSSLKAVWRHITEKTSILVIVVINSNNAGEEKDKRLFDELMKEGPKAKLKTGIYHVTKSSGPDLLIIDRFSKNMTINKPSPKAS